MTAGAKDFIVVGEVLKPHGVKGELRVASYADSPFLFDEVPRVYLRPGPRTPVPEPERPAPRRGRGRPRGRAPRPAAVHPREMKVVSWREHKGAVLMVLDGVPDRNAAEAVRGCEVLVRREDLPEPEEGELFLDELTGLSILLEDGTALGEVVDVMLPGGQEVWTIRTADGREVLFPVAEEFLLHVAPENGVVTIAPPPGLLELYLGADD